MHNDNIFLVISRCGKFRVNVMSNSNITTGYRKLDSMSVVYFRLVWFMVLWQMTRAAWELIDDIDTVAGILLDDFTVSMAASMLGILWIIHSLNDDVIMRVTVIGNENTSSESTCEFKLVWINLVDGGNN